MYVYVYVCELFGMCFIYMAPVKDNMVTGIKDGNPRAGHKGQMSFALSLKKTSSSPFLTATLKSSAMQ